MALASAAPAKAVPEVLRNSRRVVWFAFCRVVEFIWRSMFAFASFELFIAVGPIIPFRPVLGKIVRAPRTAGRPRLAAATNTKGLSNLSFARCVDERAASQGRPAVR